MANSRTAKLLANPLVFVVPIIATASLSALFLSLPSPPAEPIRLIAKVAVPGSKGFNAMALTSDSIIVGYSDHTVRRIDIDSLTVTGTYYGHKGEVLSVAASRTRDLVASASVDGSVRVWEVGPAKEWARLDGHSGAVRAVAFSPTGDTLVSAGEDGVICVWDLKAKTRMDVSFGGAEAITCLAYSDDGQFLAAGGSDGLVIIWDCPANRKLKMVRKLNVGDWVRDLAFASGGKGGQLLVTWREEVQVFEVDTGTRQEVLARHWTGATRIACARDSGLLASTSQTGIIRLWDASTWESRGSVQAHNAGPTGLAWVLGVKKLVSCCAGIDLNDQQRDGEICVWEVR